VSNEQITSGQRLWAPRVPGQRRRSPRTLKIKSTGQLIERMRRGWWLVKTCRFPGAPDWSVGADVLDPLIARQAIAAGLIVARDPGLLENNEQSFELSNDGAKTVNPFDDDIPH
jgi:hypothetical protein